MGNWIRLAAEVSTSGGSHKFMTLRRDERGGEEKSQQSLIWIKKRLYMAVLIKSMIWIVFLVLDYFNCETFYEKILPVLFTT